MASITITTTFGANPPVPAGMQDDWFNALSLAAQGRIKAQWDAIAGTADLWHKNVATISHAGYRFYPDANFSSRNGRNRSTILGLQLKKLDNAFEKAKANHDAEFANSEANYIAAVNAKAGNWSAKMPLTLALTGSRRGGLRGPASAHARGLSGDVTVQRDVGGATIITGTLDPRDQVTPEFPYIQLGLQNFFRGAIEGLLTQTGVLILHGDITDPTDANTRLTAILTSYLHSGYSGTITYTIGAPSTLVSTISGSAPISGGVQPPP